MALLYGKIDSPLTDAVTCSLDSKSCKQANVGRVVLIKAIKMEIVFK